MTKVKSCSDRKVPEKHIFHIILLIMYQMSGKWDNKITILVS
jgi:hypothetical protein